MPGPGASPDTVVSQAPVVPKTPNRLVPFAELGKGKPLEGNIFNAQNVDIYGDLHGNTAVDLNKSNGRLAILNGDIADRGPQSWPRVDQVLGKVESGDAVYNLGNHDLMFMGAMTPDASGKGLDMQSAAMWLVNHGDVTAQGAGVAFNAARKQQVDTAFQLYGSGKPENKAQADAIMAPIVNELRANQNLQRWNQSAMQHGNLYTIADGALATHAGFAVDSNGNLVDMDGWGKGLDGLDKLQDAVRHGDPKAIHYLAIGQSDNNPLWIRDKYINVVSNPNTASNLRAQLNEQAEKGSATRQTTHIEFVTVGHTPVDQLEAGQTSANPTISLTDRPGQIKFNMIDFGAYQTGTQAVLSVDMDATGNVNANLVDAASRNLLPTPEGQVVKANWKIEGTQVAVGRPPERVELAKKGIDEMTSVLGISRDQIAGKPFEEIVAAAKAKGWEVTEGTPVGDQTLDYLRNAHEYVQEQNQIAEEQKSATQITEATAAIARRNPDMARVMLEFLQNGGDIVPIIIKEGSRLAKEGSEIADGKLVNPQKLALGLDLQIAGIKYALDGLQSQEAQGKPLTATQKIDRDQHLAQLQSLTKQRKEGKIEITDAEGKKQTIESEEVKNQPNELNDFLKALGVNDQDLHRSPISALKEVTKVTTAEEAKALMDKVFKACGMNEEAVKKFYESLNEGDEKEDKSKKPVSKAEKAKKILLYGGGGLGIIMVLMMWLASRQQGQGGGGQG